MAHVKVTTDEGGGELIVVEVDGEVLVDCNDYETDVWVGAILTKLGHTYEEVEGNPYECEGEEN